MMHDARQIANWFVGRAARDKRTFSIMSLLKLVYIAHGWHLEMRKAPLFPNRIEAWKYGPVIPEVYSAFRGQGVTVGQQIELSGAPLSAATVDLLEQIYNLYGSRSAYELSDITHVPNGPWDRATKQRGWFAAIENSEIRKHYEAMRASVATG